MEEARPKFEVKTSPIEAGMTLIEASAGTGKTFTIATLVKRLLLERELKIGQILVTTYTELATAELRDRIRRKLGEEADSPRARETLDRALRNFDEAPIYTIHGFCQRMLKDRAFECGGMFEEELVMDQREVIQELAEDFWRQHFQAAEPWMVFVAKQQGLESEALQRLLSERVNHPWLRVIPRLPASVTVLRADLAVCWEKLAEIWKRAGGAIRACFDDVSWARGRHGETGWAVGQWARVERCLAGSGWAGDLEALAGFAAEKLRSNTRVRKVTPTHPFFDACDEWSGLETAFGIAMRAEFLDWASGEMARRKMRRQVFSFDDLLTRLHAALVGPGGARLAAAIREKFPAALIDEFQDTDPVQAAIFSRIYEGSDAVVACIGDPKQAIYGFRGADVFSYLDAAKTAQRQFTLGQNWRSESGLVAATNALFALRPKVFLLEGIPFTPVAAAGKADAEPLTIDGAPQPPLQLWLATADAPLPAGEVAQQLAEAVAAEIGRLLGAGTRMGARRVEPRDFAVLTRSNDEARLVQEALAAGRIPGVIYGAANIFKSREAAEMARLLEAVAGPGNEGKIRAALATNVLGFTAVDLEGLGRDESRWNECLGRFAEYHERWRDRGFIVMWRSFLVGERVRARLLGLEQGERRLTNLLQLAELLHRAGGEGRLGMDGLRKWFAGQRATADERPRLEEHELRLESDEEAVRVMTVHKSKGLEFGIVFCPFAWRSSGRGRDGMVLFHDDGKLVLDLEKTREHKALQDHEDQAEAMRLLYVAMTRAKHRSYLVWGNFHGAEKSAPARLFHPAGMTNKMSAEQVRADVTAALGAVPEVAIVDLPDADAEPYVPTRDEAAALVEPRFTGRVDGSWSISSFTGLTSGQHRDLERPEFDETAAPLVVAVEPEPRAPDIFGFPRGSGPGTCLHEILELIDFGDPGSWPAVVRRKLRKHGLRGWENVVLEMIAKAVAVPLAPGMTLAQLKPGHGLREMEFHFPIGALNPERLAACFAPFDAELAMRIGQLRFPQLRGFLKGYIDLVVEQDGRFLIVDWKSNWLGAGVEAYGPATMREEMLRSSYFLQASLYAVAWHRYLRWRRPGCDDARDFAGTAYVFLRGLEPARPELGVSRWRPEPALIAALDETLGQS